MRPLELPAPTAIETARRFAVAWRNRERQSIHHVAVLDFDGRAYRFQYLPDVRKGVPGFRPFLGFGAIDGSYTSPRLWPFFDLRLMDPKRPDYEQYTSWLGLHPDADRLDVLSRSGGEQIGDTVLLAEEPAVVDGVSEAVVLVRGVSHATREWQSRDSASKLKPGDRLDMTDDVTNPANPSAVLLSAPDGKPIGWVPDLLIEFAREVSRHEGAVTVVRNNAPEAPWHASLLVRLHGRTSPGWSAFRGRAWP